MNREYRLLEFRGTRAVELFWMMQVFNAFGIEEEKRMVEEDRRSPPERGQVKATRRKDDAYTDADIEELIFGASVAYAEAKDFGTVPPEVANAMDGPEVDIDEPVLPGGVSLRFLENPAAGTTIVLRQLTTYKRLVANIERAVPFVPQKYVRLGRDLAAFLDAASKCDEHGNVEALKEAVPTT
jgi:hypothetical protein